MREDSLATFQKQVQTLFPENVGVNPKWEIRGRFDSDISANTSVCVRKNE